MTGSALYVEKVVSAPDTLNITEAPSMDVQDTTVASLGFDCKPEVVSTGEDHLNHVDSRGRGVLEVDGDES